MVYMYGYSNHAGSAVRGSNFSEGHVTQFDVIVVGAATAGLEAAVSAAQAGAGRVIALEKAPEAESGGNARFSHTGFRFVHGGKEELAEFFAGVSAVELAVMEIPPYTAETFMADLVRVTDGKIDHALAEVLVRESNAAVRWMLESGISWQPDNSVIVDGIRHFEPGMPIQTAGGGGGGLSQMAEWRRIAEELGVEVRYRSEVTGLLGDRDAITGVRIVSPVGDEDLRAPAVILCSGGFQASPEMRARHLGENARQMIVRGSRHDTGEVLDMARRLGAADAGDWGGAHASVVDADFPRFEAGNRANRYSYMYGITVNELALRFYDEGESRKAYTYAKSGWKVLEQPGARAFQLFDRNGIELLNPAYATGTPVRADSIRELALALGLDADVLGATVDAYNAATDPSLPFNPGVLDGKATVGLNPPKSNWALPLDQPPFAAYPITAGITFTFGGLRISSNAEVLSRNGTPIRGLYASGDIVGLFHRNYPSGSGQTRNAVFSRIAGRMAAGMAIASASTT
jgi:tricarballylate dehydrogenase